MSTSDRVNRDSEADHLKRQIPFFSKLIATGFYCGYIPWASGTFGSFFGALFFLVPAFESVTFQIIAIVAAFAAGVVASGQVAEVMGHRLSNSAKRLKEQLGQTKHGTPDPSIVVIDEIVGMWISVFAIHPTLLSVAIAFMCFRFFDILKPYPARQMERFQHGWGIMLDDVVAGIYANIATRVLIVLVHQFIPNLM